MKQTGQHWRLMGLVMGIVSGVFVASLPVDADAHIHAYRLDNGIQTYILEDPSATIASVRVVVQAGGNTEAPCEGSGISHYLEHVVAGGSTTHRSEQAYSEQIDYLGGAFNAYTTDDHTGYFINTGPGQVSAAIQIVSEWMFDCAFDPKEVARERGVIQQEMRRAWADPNRLMYRYAQEQFYADTVAQYPVLGYLGRFNALTPSDLLDYYQTHYVPDNMLVLVGGAVDVDAVKAAVAQAFGRQPYTQAPPRMRVLPQPVMMPRELAVEGPTTVEHVSIRFPTVALSHPDLYPLDLMAYILGHGRESVLHRRLVVETGLANAVSVYSVTPVDATGYFEIRLSVDPALRDAAVHAVYDTLNTRFIKRSAVRRAKQQKLAEDAQLSQALPDRLDRLAQSHLATGGPGFYAYYARQFAAVTRAELQRVWQTYLQEQLPIVTRLTPELKLKSDQDALTMRTDVLANGVPLFIQPDATDPAVRVVFRFLHGATAELPGATALASQLFGLGSNRLTQHAESVGAQVELSMGRDESVITLTGAPTVVEDLVRHVQAAVYDPVIDADDFAVEQRLVLDRIRKRRDHWARDAFAQVRADFYRNHPYATPLDGDADSVLALTPANIRAVYQALQVAPLVISVSGDCEPTRVYRQMERLFGKTPKQPARAPIPVAPKDFQGTHAKTLKQPVAAVILAVDAAAMDDPAAQMDWQVLDTVLAGMQYPGGRLHPLLRGQELVYVVHGVLQVYKDHGLFYIYALTSPESVATVQQQLVDTIELLKTAGLQPNERDRAKAQIRYAYQQAQDPPSSRVHQAARYRLWGLPLDTDQQQLARLSTYTDADIQAMAQQAFQSWKLYVFLPE
ncbi:MAG: hypothetical protein CMJ93_02515 [Planctomycetes bacterium]|nr:hypothetical protein [Planctomycetota bacterium]